MKDNSACMVLLPRCLRFDLSFPQHRSFARVGSSGLGHAAAALYLFLRRRSVHHGQMCRLVRTEGVHRIERTSTHMKLASGTSSRGATLHHAQHYGKRFRGRPSREEIRPGCLRRTLAIINSARRNRSASISHLKRGGQWFT